VVPREPWGLCRCKAVCHDAGMPNVETELHSAVHSSAQEPGATSLRRIRDLPGPKAIPLLGNVHQVNPRRLHLELEQWARLHGPFFRVRFGMRDVLVIGDLTSLQRIMSERPDVFRRIATVEPILRELGAPGLFSAEGSAWKRQRRLVMPAFSMKQQRALFPAIARITDRLREHWLSAAARGEAVDVRSDLMRYTVDVTSQVVFGSDLNTLGGREPEMQQHLSRIFHAANSRVNALFPYWRYFKLPQDRAVDRSIAYVQSMIGKLVAETRGRLVQGVDNEEMPTLLEALVAAQDEDEPASRLSDDDVSGNVLTLLLAGEDTTSNTLSWVLHYLAHEPDVQARVAQEARTVLGDVTLPTAHEQVPQLKVAMAVVHETLRMRAAAPLLFFEPMQDVDFEGIAVPAGTWIFTLPRHCGMLDAHFHDAQSFNPDRWLQPGEGDSTRAHNPRAALAFGSGPRTCPGRSLALLECAMVTSMVARNFEVVPATAREAVEEVFDFTMYPSGLKVFFKARS